MKVAVVGATGLVGSKMLQVLEERNFPVTELLPVASERSVGRKVLFKGKEWTVIGADEAIARKPSLAIFSAGGAASAELAPRFAAAGCRVVDNSSYWRMDPTKKLVVPEINGDVLEADDYIIANPNCSTIQMVLPLAPLHKAFVIKRIVVSTYQSVTGTGQKGIAQLEAERRGDAEGSYRQVYPHRIDLNILPHIDSFLDNGYTKEEMKMFNEPRKIMHSDVKCSAMCVRISALRSHSEAVWIETEEPLEVRKVQAALAVAPGVTLKDDPEEHEYPMPLYTAGKDNVYVGRVRKDLANENGITLWLSADQIKKGAALNAVQIAEYLISQKD